MTVLFDMASDPGELEKQLPLYFLTDSYLQPLGQKTSDDGTLVSVFRIRSAVDTHRPTCYAVATVPAIKAAMSYLYDIRTNRLSRETKPSAEFMNDACSRLSLTFADECFKLEVATLRGDPIKVFKPDDGLAALIAA